MPIEMVRHSQPGYMTYISMCSSLGYMNYPSYIGRMRVLVLLLLYVYPMHRRIQDFWLGGDMNINEGRGTVNYKRINCSYMYTASFE